RNTLYGLKFW
ncbi:hypothetical protein D022_1273B, partial [Vibrio parahaemolyticus 12310]